MRPETPGFNSRGGRLADRIDEWFYARGWAFVGQSCERIEE